MTNKKHDARREFEGHFVSLFKDSPDSAIVVDPNNDKIQYANNTFEKIFGTSHKDFKSLISKEDHHTFEAFKEELSQKHQGMFNCRVTTLEGTLFEAMVRAYWVPGDHEAIFQ